MRSLIAVLLIIVSFLAFAMLIAGSHGRIQFRPHMTEDWFFWSIIIIPAFIGIYILVAPLFKTLKK